jgi:hypothetical protein
MPIPNRELSQFGSFLYVDNSTRNIGIGTTQIPNIGIGTINPTSKLHVVGNANITGILSAGSFYLNGSPLVDVAIQAWELSGSNVYRTNGNVGIASSSPESKLTVSGNAKFTGIVTATTFVGSFNGTATTADNLSGNDFTRIGNITASRFISTITSGTPPFTVSSATQVTNLNASLLGGYSPPTSVIVGVNDVQTLTNKTLTSPSISNASLSTPTITSGGFTLSGSTSGSTVVRASSIASGTLTLPAATDTLVARDTSDTLTNKTISASSNTISGLTNSNLSGTAAISNSNLANSTISGISLGNNLFSLSFDQYLTASSSYNGSAAISVSVAATTANTGSTVVARNSGGGFNAGGITATSFAKSGGTSSQFLKADGSVDSTSYTSPGKAIAISMVFGY